MLKPLWGFLLLVLLVFNENIFAASCEQSAESFSSGPQASGKLSKYSAHDLVREVKNMNRRKDQTIRLDRITPDNVEAAYDIMLVELEQKISEFENKEIQPNFRNTILKLEYMFKDYDQFNSVTRSVFSNRTKEFEEVAAEIAKKNTNFMAKYRKNKVISERVNFVIRSLENRKLSEETRKLVEAYKDLFTRMDEASEARVVEINLRLKELSDSFGANVLAYMEKSLVEFTKDELDGLSDSLLAVGKKIAKANSSEHYMFTASEVYTPALLGSLKNSESRKKIFKAFSQIGITEDFDNRPIITEILQLRQELATIKAFDNYAEYSVDKKAAPSLVEVISFLENLRDLYYYNAKKEIAELRDFKKKKTNSSELFPWDFAYWSELYKEEKLGFSSNELNPYFEFKRFQIAFHKEMEKYYGIELKERKDLPSMVEGAETYEVLRDGKTYAFLYVDIFARKGKRGGAWMYPAIRGYRDRRGQRRIPSASINQNVVKPVDSEPVLLSPREAKTYAHEFGHGLHLILSDTKLLDQFGLKVPWDVVEVPSQFNENFLLNKEFLKTLRHYETNEPLPDELVDGFLANSNFQAGYAGLRQTAFLGLLDLEIHRLAAEQIHDPVEFEKKFVEPYGLFDPVDFPVSTLGRFSHIFKGGYAAGYYSYKWAEIIEADAFKKLQEAKDPMIMTESWIQNVLSIGGSRDFNEGVKTYLGRDIDPKALVERSGLEIPE
ncbi:MAG: M3 family metallopeptidase [Bdellovibrionota bacterium]|nr:M3 family metallopeptidase [Bdellovibrionota bacterium]